MPLLGAVGIWAVFRAVLVPKHSGPQSPTWGVPGVTVVRVGVPGAAGWGARGLPPRGAAGKENKWQPWKAWPWSKRAVTNSACRPLPDERVKVAAAGGLRRALGWAEAVLALKPESWRVSLAVPLVYRSRRSSREAGGEAQRGGSVLAAFKALVAWKRSTTSLLASGEANFCRQPLVRK